MTVTPCKTGDRNPPPEQEVNKNVFMGKLHDMVNWGRKTQFGPTTSAFLLLSGRERRPFTAVHDVARFGGSAARRHVRLT